MDTREFRLRWSPTEKFLIIPGDEILKTRPQTFWLSGAKLIDPELFRQASIEHGWPDLSLLQWRKKVILALCECEYNDRAMAWPQSIKARKAVNNLLDARITLEECIDVLDRIGV